MRCLASVLLASVASCSPAPRPNRAAVSAESFAAATLRSNTPTTPLTCPEHAEITYPATLSACATGADCMVVEHSLDCCGSVMKAGIAASQRAAFDSIEASCRARVNGRMCGCAAFFSSQLGERITPSTPVRVSCVSGACVASSAALAGASAP